MAFFERFLSWSVDPKFCIYCSWKAPLKPPKFVMIFLFPSQIHHEVQCIKVYVVNLNYYFSFSSFHHHMHWASFRTGEKRLKRKCDKEKLRGSALAMDTRKARCQQVKTAACHADGSIRFSLAWIINCVKMIFIKLLLKTSGAPPLF